MEKGAGKLGMMRNYQLTMSNYQLSINNEQ
jgi:hypothetical protein